MCARKKLQNINKYSKSNCQILMRKGKQNEERTMTLTSKKVEVLQGREAQNRHSTC